jgi:hypothetical protein
VDSLVAIELRKWLLETFEFAVPLLELLDESKDIKELSAAVVQGMASKRVYSLNFFIGSNPSNVVFHF